MSASAATAQLGFLAIIPRLMTTKQFWNGVFLGLQEDKNDQTSQCFVAWDALYTLIVSSNISYGLFEASSKFKGITATDMGYLFHLGSIG